ncbi:MAG: HAD-IA family hydrolase [Alphaproteobacteria bacterium]|nr:HAD-IA family hydrolase [Alphaproteobacteria bacterium]
MARILILDAMGVLYQAGDDVAELLVPFVQRHGRADLSAAAIDLAYTEASLGKVAPDAFWRSLGVDPSLEDDYLAGHRLIDGTLEVLPELKRRFGRLACLSNDIGPWSRKLRQRFGLERWIEEWFISGDLGLRKPDAAIYLRALRQLGADASDVVFVDDRPRNLDAALRLGIQTMLLDGAGSAPASSHRAIGSLTDLL